MLMPARWAQMSNEAREKWDWRVLLNHPPPMATGEKHGGGRSATYRQPGRLILVGNAIVKPDQYQCGKKCSSNGSNNEQHKKSLRGFYYFSALTDER